MRSHGPDQPIETAVEAEAPTFGEAVNDAARDEDAFSRCQIDVPPGDAPGARAAETIYGFVPALVIMGNRHSPARAQEHFEQVKACVRILP